MRRVLFVLVIALSLLLITSAIVHARPNEWITIRSHVVRYGETIFCIGRAYGVSPWAIAVHNGIANPNLVYPGQVLAIPNAYASVPAGPTCVAQGGVPSGGGCVASHTIVAGENLYRISLHYGVNMWHIARCNGIFNLNYIRVGDVLCIPGP